MNEKRQTARTKQARRLALRVGSIRSKILQLIFVLIPRGVQVGMRCERLLAADRIIHVCPLSSLGDCSHRAKPKDVNASIEQAHKIADEREKSGVPSERVGCGKWELKGCQDSTTGSMSHESLQKARITHDNNKTVMTLKV